MMSSGVPAPTYYVASGNLPGAVTLGTSDGELGTQSTAPYGPGTFTFRIGATNGVGAHAVSPKTTVTITGNPVRPDAPVIGTAKGGDGQASVSFTPGSRHVAAHRLVQGLPTMMERG